MSTPRPDMSRSDVTTGASGASLRFERSEGARARLSHAVEEVRR